HPPRGRAARAGQGAHARGRAQPRPRPRRLRRPRQGQPGDLSRAGTAAALAARPPAVEGMSKSLLIWLLLLWLGVTVLSLGIAYFLASTYRAEPFPGWVYYLTLQFLGRSVRGVLFVAAGVGVILLSLRGLGRSPWVRDHLL